MGGDTAKEKRKSKRMQAAGNGNITVAQPATVNPSATIVPAPSPPQPPATKKENSGIVAKSNVAASPSQSNSAGALLRLKRKIERKAIGKFKTGSTEKRSPASQQKRRFVEGKDPLPSKRLKNDASRDSFNLKPPPAKQKKQKATTEANKKPKHLNRKLGQLSKSLADRTVDSSAGNIAQLEAQMKQLAEQIEKIKNMKEGALKVTSHPQIENESENKAEFSKNSSSSTNRGPPVRKEERVSNTPAMEAVENKTVSSSSSSSSSENDSSSDEQSIDDSNTRSRGKRRRGRRDKDNVAENVKQVHNKTEEINGGGNEKAQVTKSSTDEAQAPSKKKTSKKDDTRRCIGRKAVTDYTVGQKISGKVKYIKPTLGAFIDIGSHSDAFCHISCVSNEYVSSVDEVLNVNDEVKARVVEINREKKRITVSLRGEEMAQLEQNALQSKQKGCKSLQRSMCNKNEKKAQHNRFEPNRSERQFEGDKKNDAHISSNLDSRNVENEAHARPLSSAGAKTGVDLKRERKLARRAERRAQNMVVG